MIVVDECLFGTYMGMGFLSWGWVGQILEGGVNFFARGRGQIFFAKKGGKGVGKFFFAKNVKNLPVLSDFNGFLKQF